jgi:hypothetical protein
MTPHYPGWKVRLYWGKPVPSGHCPVHTSLPMKYQAWICFLLKLCPEQSMQEAVMLRYKGLERASLCDTSDLMLSNPGPFQLTHYKWPRSWFINDYWYLKFKVLYFSIQLYCDYNIVFHCLGHVVPCVCGNFCILSGRRSLEFWHRQSLILAWVQKTHAYKSQVKNSKSYICLQMRTTQKGHYDIVASLRLPCEGWNDKYQSAPGRTRIF